MRNDARGHRFLLNPHPNPHTEGGSGVSPPAHKVAAGYVATPMTITRRGLLGWGSAAAVTAVTGPVPAARHDGHRSTTLIRGGHLLTLDPELGELPDADVLIDDDRIVEISRHIRPRGRHVTTIDAEGMIVAPGLVDNHRHLWVTLLRGFSADHTFNDYFAKVLFDVSPRLTPHDVYLGCLLGAYEALDSGVTTVLDWNHGTNTRAHALAAVQALRESGIRALFAYSSPAADSVRADAPPSAEDIEAVRRAVRHDPLVNLAIATRNPESADDAGLRRIAGDIELARRLAAPVTLHTGFGTGRSAPRWLAHEGLLGPETMLVHGNAFTAEELELIAGAGAWVTLAPETEMQMGLGAPPLRAMLDAGVRPTVSVDVVAAAAGDLRLQLRLLLQTQRMLDHRNGYDGPMLSLHTVLPYVTGYGASSLGLAAEVGCMAPGRQADLVLIDRTDPAVAPARSAAVAALVAHPGAIDTVLVAGRVVKRRGRLTGVDLPRLRRLAETASRRLLDGVGD
jgi:5-methylthioadenosine/S-adenosylhomocysteine deaminase